MSKVKAVAVTAYCHSPLNQPKGGVISSGSSEIKWAVKGTYLANNHCVVVVEAESARDGKGSRVNSAASGGIFPEGKEGVFCEITLEADDPDNWKLAVATGKDQVANKELIFQGGTGRRAR